MTRKQLLEKLHEIERRMTSSALDERERLLRDLQLHQVELEMQNRELRESQQLLEESRARLADLYDSAPIGYLTVDKQGRITEANLAAAALLGVWRGALIGSYLSDALKTKDRRAVRQHLQDCLQGRSRVENQVTISGAGHRRVTAQMTSVPHLDRDGAVSGCKTTLTDVSALKRARDTLAFLVPRPARRDHKRLAVEIEV